MGFPSDSLIDLIRSVHSETPGADYLRTSDGGGGGGGGNASVGSNGATAPTSSTQIAGVDESGNLQPLTVDGTGALKIAGITAFVTQDVRVLYNEVSTIAIGVETDINTYTAPSGKVSYLLTITNSGENRAQFTVYLEGNILDKKYTNVTQLDALLDYKTGASSVPGMIVPVGQTILVTTINNGTSSANYSSRFLILETT